MAHFAVLGSAHLDILSYARFHEETLDRPGDLYIGYGGSGFNLAVNLAHYGHQVTFGTILSDTNISQTIISALHRANVNARPDFRPGLPEAGFSAHIASNGEMLSAVTSTPVELVPFREKHVAHLVGNADAVVLECNLHQDTMTAAAKLANELGKRVWLAGVSEAKSLKILECARSGVAIDGVFVNAREMRFVLRAMGEGATPQRLAKLCGGMLVETRGPEGVAVWTGDKSEPLSTLHFPETEAGDGHVNWLGAGDHLMALSLHHYHQDGEPLSRAACTASATVSAQHHRRNCNLGHMNPLEERMQHLSDAALRDQLTKLANRRGFEDFVSQVSPEAEGALLMLDIDHFKRINDTFGHDVGDIVLAEVGGMLRGALRATDCACRWGGEEMLAVLLYSNETSAADVAERIRRTIENFDFPTCGKVTCSIGVAAGALGQIPALREAADRALYHGKRSGRNKVVRASAVAAEPQAQADAVGSAA